MSVLWRPKVEFFRFAATKTKATGRQQPLVHVDAKFRFELEMHPASKRNISRACRFAAVYRTLLLLYCRTRILIWDGPGLNYDETRQDLLDFTPFLSTWCEKKFLKGPVQFEMIKLGRI